MLGENYDQFIQDSTELEVQFSEQLPDILSEIFH
jgi:hypothetical protein